MMIKEHYIPSEVSLGKFDNKFKDFIKVRSEELYVLIFSHTEEERERLLEKYPKES